MQFGILIEDAEVKKLINRAERAINTPWKRIKARTEVIVRRGIAKNWARQPWEPLTERYLKRKKAAGYGDTILVLHGSLRRSAIAVGYSRIEGNTLRVLMRPDLPYVAVHQYGYKNIPARPYFVVEESVPALVTKLVNKTLREAL